MVITLFLTGMFTAMAIAFMVYHSNAHWSVKSVALMTFLTVGVVSFEMYQDMLGAPIPSRPVGEHSYIWHTVTADQPPQIVIWTYNKERGYRLYQYEYIREEAAELEEIRQGAMDGQPEQRMQFSDGSEGDPLRIIKIPNQNFTKP